MECRIPDLDDTGHLTCARGMKVRVDRLGEALEEPYGIDGLSRMSCIAPVHRCSFIDAVSQNLAELRSARCLLRHRFLRRHPGQDPRRGVRSQQGGVYRPIPYSSDGTKVIRGSRGPSMTEGAYMEMIWLLVMNELGNRRCVFSDPARRRSKVLKGFRSRGISSVTFPDVPVSSDLYRSPDPPLWPLNFSSSAGSKSMMPRRSAPHSGQGRSDSRPFFNSSSRPVLGREISCHRTELAAQLGTRLALLCLPQGGTQDCLHHKRHRVAQRQDPARCPHPRPLPQ